MINNSLILKNLKIRANDYDGNSYKNNVNLTCAGGLTGQTYSIELPNNPPTNADQVLMYNGNNFNWQTIANPILKGITQNDVTDEEGNLLSIIKEVPLEQGDLGYDSTLAFNGGTKIKTSFTNNIYNMANFSASNNGQVRLIDTANGNQTLGPIGTPLQSPTQLVFGDLINNLLPSLSSNITNWNSGLQRNAQLQYQDTVSLITRVETNNSNNLIPNNFSVININPNTLTLLNQQGAGADGSVKGNNINLKIDGGVSGGEFVSISKNSTDLFKISSNSLNYYMPDIASTFSIQSAGVTLNYNGSTRFNIDDNLNLYNSIFNFQIFNGGFAFKNNSINQGFIGPNNIIFNTGNGTSSGEYILNLYNETSGLEGFSVNRINDNNTDYMSLFTICSTKFSLNTNSLSMNSNGTLFNINYKSNDKIIISDEISTIQVSDASSILNLTPSSLNYQTDNFIYVTNNLKSESLLNIKKDSFNLTSTTTVTSSDYDSNDQTISIQSNTDKANENLQLSFIMKDGSQTNKTKTAFFNRTPFNNNQLSDFNIDSPSMKFSTGLPQLELVSDDSSQRARIFLNNNGNVYIQTYDSVSGKWIGANIIADNI
jgi:hypothetical protein